MFYNWEERLLKKIALISFDNKRRNTFNFVKNIDRESQLFRLSINYSKKIADDIFILTIKYGLVKESDYKSSDSEDGEFRSEMENKLWSLEILDQLNKFTDIHEDEYFILADKNYYRNYSKFLKNVQIPLKNMSIETQIDYLKKELNENEEDKKTYGEKLHILFNSMKKYNYDNFDDIPFTNGVYVVLDKKEKYKDMNRIVRVGTHYSDNNLIIRMKNHYKKGFKDNSFFRKNIGKSILSYNKHYYLYIWNINFNDKDNQIKFNNLRDMEVEDALDEKISNYMKDRFEFVCFEVNDLKERRRLEEGLISTIYNDEEFTSSKNWLGKYSTLSEVRDSNMWVCKGLDKKQLSIDEFRKIVNLCIKSSEEVENYGEIKRR